MSKGIWGHLGVFAEGIWGHLGAFGGIEDSSPAWMSSVLHSLVTAGDLKKSRGLNSLKFKKGKWVDGGKPPHGGGGAGF